MYKTAVKHIFLLVYSELVYGYCFKDVESIDVLIPNEEYSDV